ncbi:MAG: hypothetical protein M1839_004000 [Geoglossum umbratile]|nr:MAG: hypothetical protein M1839_004000 [Geoglossum umbratile]
MQDFYELDPDGDLVFILAHDNEDENGLAEHEIPLTGAELPEAPPLGPDIIQFLWPTSVNTLVAEAPITDVPADVQASTPIEALTEPSAENQSYDTLTDGSAGIEGSGQNKEVRFRVSSRHMILASPVFKVMLRQEFKEAIVLRSTGKLEVTLEDDCPAAFLILLNIIHGHVRLVPREIDLDMLTRVAIIVDKYDCLEVVEIFSDMWFSKLRKKLPGSFTKTLLPWLCITWVFERADEFMLMTQIAQRESTGNIEEELANGLPIPSSILGQFYHRQNGYLNTTPADAHFQT